MSVWLIGASVALGFVMVLRRRRAKRKQLQGSRELATLLGAPALPSLNGRWRIRLGKRGKLWM